MHFLKKKYISWFTLFLALSMWSTVGFLAWSVSGNHIENLSAETLLEEEAGEIEAALRLHTLARDTKDVRVELESLANKDAISIVEAIEAIGDDANVSIEIGQVLSEPPALAASPAVPALRNVGVAVEVLGSFRAVMHAAALMYSLPIPSVVEGMQLEKLPVEERTAGKEWRLIMQVQVFTTANISS